MKHFHFNATVFAIALQVTTAATAADTPPTVSAFDGCVAGRLALNSGGMTAQAAAYKACREQYPATPEENEAMLQLRRKISAGNSSGASGSTGTSTSSIASSGTSSGTTPASAPSPVSTPAASPPPSTPASTPSASPGASGGNPHGGAPGQSKK